MRKAAFEKILELGKADERVLFAASDISGETVKDLEREMPGRCFMEGIAEGHLVGMAAGLAKEGNIVFINTIASFLSKRSFEQIAINLCLENANVKLLAQGGGLVYGQLGPTHHANEDIALMRTLPNMTVLVPCDVEQVRQSLDFAYRHDGPIYIRLAKGSAPIISSGHTFEAGRPISFTQADGILFIATGTMIQVALKVSERIPGSGVVGVHTMKPFCTGDLARMIDRAKTVITLEEHSEIGGLSSCICETIAKHCQTKPRLITFSLKDRFVREYGKQEELLFIHGLDAEAIFSELTKSLETASRVSL